MLLHQFHLNITINLRESKFKWNYFSVSSAPMKCMRINKRMKFKSSANVCSSHSVRDRIQRSWMHWEITSTSDFIPWVPTFSYLLPKIKKRETFAVESLQWFFCFENSYEAKKAMWWNRFFFVFKWIDFWLMYGSFSRTVKYDLCLVNRWVHFHWMENNWIKWNETN